MPPRLQKLWFTIGLAGVSLLGYSLPWLGNRFVYDRVLIGEGEIWRLVSGNWFHFSLEHLAYNTLIIGVCGLWLESRRPRYYRILSLLTMMCIGLYSHLFLPEMMRYGGLSGLATALLVALALDELRTDKSRKRVWWGLLVLVAGKIIYEMIAGAPLFVTPTQSFEVVPAVHVVGAVVAIVIHILSSRMLSRRSVLEGHCALD